MRKDIQMKIKRKIVETYCYPSCYQIQPDDPRHNFVIDNATHLFKPTIEECVEQIKKQGDEFTGKIEYLSDEDVMKILEAKTN